MSLTKNEIKFIKSLHIKKNRVEHALFIVEGEKLVSELLKQSKFKIQALYFTQKFDQNDIPNGVSSTLISDKDLSRISGFKTPNNVLAIVQQNQSTQVNFEASNLTLVLDDINDPGNLGTIIRTAEWFGITQIIASPNTVDLYNPKVIQASMGAIYRMNYLVSDLKSVLPNFLANGYDVLGAFIDGENVYQNAWPKKSVLVMGSESHGISDEISKLVSKQITIPKFGGTESLNVGIATGILISEYARHFNLQKL